MPRGSGFSVQTLLVLAALSGRPVDWRHGYDLAKQTGLKSGTLYPILVRLADRGMVEARWEEHRAGGRPAAAPVPAQQRGPGPGAGGAGRHPHRAAGAAGAAPAAVPRRGLVGEGL